MTRPPSPPRGCLRRLSLSLGVHAPPIPPQALQTLVSYRGEPGGLALPLQGEACLETPLVEQQ